MKVDKKKYYLLGKFMKNVCNLIDLELKNKNIINLGNLK